MPDRPFLVGGRAPVSRAAFAAAVTALAARLRAETPADAPLLLLCGARGPFLTALCAALAESRPVLLPNDTAPHSLARLAERHAGLTVLSDGMVAADLPVLTVTPPDPDAWGEMPALDADRPLVRLFTSGSTGAPVEHARPWSALALGAEPWRRALAVDAATVVATVPPQHMYGLEASAVLPLVCPDVAVHEGRPFYPEDLRAALETVEGAGVLVTTPVHLRVLVRAGLDLPPLHRIVSATAPLPADLAARAEALWGAPVLDVYGSTETGMLATRRTARDDLWRTRDDVTLRIGDGRAMADGPHLAAPVTLADVVEPAEGGFRLLGRGRDLVNVAGKRASLAGLTALLLQVPGVRDGIFHLREGAERPEAVVVAPDLGAEALRAELLRRMDPVFVPRRIVFVDALPRNAVGKLPREAVERLL